MTYPTHKQYAVSFSFIAAMLLYKFGMTQIDYFLALPILILTAKYGGLFPDIDHHWQSVKDKTVPNWIINKLIHITGGKHRSWQTHSIDILVASTLFMYFTPEVLYKYSKITLVNKEVMGIILMGFCAGWASHLLADMMTSAGVRLFCWNKKIIIKLVPKHIGKFRFNTGNEWEEFVFKSVRTINILLGIVCIIYPFILGYNGIDIIAILRDTLIKPILTV